MARMARNTCCISDDAKNSKAKLVCPIRDCRKQSVDQAQLGKHLLKDHPKDVALKDKKDH